MCPRGEEIANSFHFNGDKVLNRLTSRPEESSFSIIGLFLSTTKSIFVDETERYVIDRFLEVQPIRKFFFLMKLFNILVNLFVPASSRWCSNWDAHRHYTAARTVGGGEGWHCPIVSKQQRFLNPYQEHQEFRSGPPSKLSVGPIFLSTSIRLTVKSTWSYSGPKERISPCFPP